MTTIEKRFFHLSPTSPARARLEEAEHYYLLGNYNEALAAAQQAWREHPHASDVYRVLAYIHMSRGEYEPAAQAAYQSVVVDGDNPASYATLAQVYLTFNMAKHADETLVAARQRFPDDAALAVLLADLRFRLRQDTDGVRLAKHALTLNHEDGYANALLGVHYLRKKRYTEAVAPLAVAVRAYPKRWDYLRDAGIARLQTGNPVAARELLTQSVRLNPLDQSTKHHLLYAIRLSEPDPTAYWRISFFFYNCTWLGWVLTIIGYTAVMVGFLWLLVVLATAGDTLLRDAVMPTAFLLGGAALIAVTTSGILMRARKGRRFDLFLWRAIQGDMRRSEA